MIVLAFISLETSTNSEALARSHKNVELTLDQEIEKEKINGFEVGEKEVCSNGISVNDEVAEGSVFKWEL